MARHTLTMSVRMPPKVKRRAAKAIAAPYENNPDWEPGSYMLFMAGLRNGLQRATPDGERTALASAALDALDLDRDDPVDRAFLERVNTVGLDAFSKSDLIKETFMLGWARSALRSAYAEKQHGAPVPASRLPVLEIVAFIHAHRFEELIELISRAARQFATGDEPGAVALVLGEGEPLMMTERQPLDPRRDYPPPLSKNGYPPLHPAYVATQLAKLTREHAAGRPNALTEEGVAMNLCVSVGGFGAKCVAPGAPGFSDAVRALRNRMKQSARRAAKGLPRRRRR